MSSSTSRSRSSRRISPIRARWYVTALLAASVLAAAAPVRAAEVWIDVSKEAERKVAVALPPLTASEGPDETTLRLILGDDLVKSGYFRILPLGDAQLAQAAQERDAPQPDLAAWASSGAELLLRANAVRQDGRLLLRAELFDVGGRTRLLSHSDGDAPSEAPRMAHRLADAVVQALTGGAGIAQSRIAATWTDGDAPKRVVVMDYDGRDMRPLSAAGMLALFPTWFPDNSQIAYVTYRKGRQEIVSHSVTSGQVRSLAFFPGANASPSISPDGRHLLMVLSRDGNTEIYRTALDGSELKRLTVTRNGTVTEPAWSPDGTQIALVSDQGGGPQIYLLGANGGRLRRVSWVSQYATSPAWSPRGDRIVYAARLDGAYQLVLLDTATRSEQQLTFGGQNKESPSFAPDGRHVVCSEGSRGSYRLAVYDTLTGERVWELRTQGNLTSPAWSR